MTSNSQPGADEATRAFMERLAVPEGERAAVRQSLKLVRREYDSAREDAKELSEVGDVKKLVGRLTGPALKLADALLAIPPDVRFTLGMIADDLADTQWRYKFVNLDADLIGLAVAAENFKARYQPATNRRVNVALWGAVEGLLLLIEFDLKLSVEATFDHNESPEPRLHSPGAVALVTFVRTLDGAPTPTAIVDMIRTVRKDWARKGGRRGPDDPSRKLFEAQLPQDQERRLEWELSLSLLPKRGDYLSKS